jgi:hypothetical protein
MRKLTFKDIIDKTGTLSDTSKMPCHSTSTPTENCNVGSFLRTVEGSTCHGCYAHERGNYTFPSVKKSLANRLDKISGPDWVFYMAEHIRRRCTDLFRWHDSGDIQDASHLRKIVEIARQTPLIRHWLPTREYKLLINYLGHGGEFPPNLIVRISAPMKGPAFQTHDNKKVQVLQAQFEQLALVFGLPISTVDDPDSGPDTTCPAPTQDGECRDCRRCWEPTQTAVNYLYH